jgi:hypothetical protein
VIDVMLAGRRKSSSTVTSARSEPLIAEIVARPSPTAVS